MNCSRPDRKFATVLRAGGLAAVLLAPISEAVADCGPPDTVYIASVCTTAANFCPRGYAPLNGQMLAISSDQALFSLLGCAWGGDCRSTFALPDMRGRSPVGTGAGPGLTPIQLGQFRGSESRTLTISQMPSHSHTAVESEITSSVTVNAYDGNGASPTPSTANSFLQTVAENPFSPSTTANLYGTGTGNEVPLGGASISVTGTVTVGNTGGGKSFSTQSPVMALTYCIATEGLYPPRN